MPAGIGALDRLIHAIMGRVTGNLSPPSVGIAVSDWAFHLAISPGKQAELGVKALRKATRLAIYAVESASNPQTPPCVQPLPRDHRFDDERWRSWPCNLWYQIFLLHQQRW